jgi:hypothetical protein
MLNKSKESNREIEGGVGDGDGDQWTMLTMERPSPSLSVLDKYLGEIERGDDGLNRL